MSLSDALCPDTVITPEIQAFLDREKAPNREQLRADAWDHYYARCEAEGVKPDDGVFHA